MPPRRKPLLDLESDFQGEHDDVAPRPKLRRRAIDEVETKVEDTSNQATVETSASQSSSRLTRASQWRLVETKVETSGDSAASTKNEPPARKKKDKEFAWMDSDAEDSDSEKEHESKKTCEDDPVGLFQESRSNQDASRKSSRKTRSRSRSARSRSSSGGPPLPASISDVQTFGQMVRMAESLKKRARSMGSTELVQCLAASARVKFFDGDFLQDMLIPQIRRQLNIPRKKSPFTTQEIVDILSSLADLNCFNKTVFAGCVKELADRRYLELQGADKMRILAAFKAVKYDCDEDRQFFDYLSSSVKADRYEVLSAEQRMIVGNSKSGMHGPEGYLRSFMIGTAGSGKGVSRPHGLSS